MWLGSGCSTGTFMGPVLPRSTSPQHFLPPLFFLQVAQGSLLQFASDPCSSLFSVSQGLSRVLDPLGSHSWQYFIASLFNHQLLPCAPPLKSATCWVARKVSSCYPPLWVLAHTSPLAWNTQCSVYGVTSYQLSVTSLCVSDSVKPFLTLSLAPYPAPPEKEPHLYTPQPTPIAHCCLHQNHTT